MIQNLDCFLYSILQRITPIEFVDGVLVISTAMSVNTSITIDNVVIEGNNGTLELPEGTTVGGTPLISPHYVNNVYVLPSNTVIDNFAVLNTNYFYFFSTDSAVLLSSNQFINNTFFSDSSSSYAPNYPFLVPSACVLTSLLFSVYVNSGFFSTITNMKATIYTISSDNVVTNTGISTTIASCPLNSRNFNSTNFQYSVSAKTRVGIRIEYNGSVSSDFAPFATLGYKFL